MPRDVRPRLTIMWTLAERPTLCFTTERLHTDATVIVGERAGRVKVMPHAMEAGGGNTRWRSIRPR
eukprot:6909719-Alexandrium_andersonii.AAC.1